MESNNGRDFEHCAEKIGNDVEGIEEIDGEEVLMLPLAPARLA